MYKIFFIGLIFLIVGQANAQSTRSLNNDGVDLYKEGKYADAEVNFKKSLENSENNFKGNFNLGDAYYKQKRYEEALKSYQKALSESKDKMDKAKVYHNIGNSLLKSKKIKESIEAYKNSLKLNPNDDDTKYNLSYALSMLNKDKNKNQQNQNKNDKNKDKKNKDQNKNDQNNKNQQNKNKDQKQQQDKQNQQNQNKPNKNQEAKQDNLKQPDKNKITKAEAERILDALKNNEKELQKNIRRKRGNPIKTDKDW